MARFTLAELETAARQVHEFLPETPQYEWPLLSARLGARVWVKHENHLSVGAFKVRGGVLVMRRLKESGVGGIIAATRGNHGLSLAFAARRLGLSATVVVPHGNSRSKNRAMRGFGAELVEHGHDFQAALEHATALAGGASLHFIPSFSFDLVLGVSSYALEWFRAVPNLDVVYVPIGLGSGICGVISVRDALSLRTEVVGVVSEGAPCYALSFEAGQPVSTEAADTLADGLACRVPHPEAVEYIRRGAARVVRVSDRAIRAAMRHLFTDTHNVAEGAGAAALAAAEMERPRLAAKRVGVVLSGGNVDQDVLARVFAEEEPA